MRRILTYGTFDLFHIGHLEILRRARALGDHLTVGVSTDEFNRIKSKRCVYPYEQRAAIVSACRFVDVVIPEERWTQKADDVRRLGIDLVVMGDDWVGRFDEELAGLCEVVYLPRTAGISTTEVKETVRSDF